MRYTNLGITSNYMMAVNEYMQAAVRNLDVTQERPPGAVPTELPLKPLQTPPNASETVAVEGEVEP